MGKPNTFPLKSWKNIFLELEGSNELKFSLNDTYYRNNNYQYEFDFIYKNSKARFYGHDITNPKSVDSHFIVNEINKFMIIGFEYPFEPRLNLLLSNRPKFFELINKILGRHISLNMTVLNSNYIFESNKPNLAKLLIHELLFMSNYENAFVSNDFFDFHTEKQYLIIKIFNWIDDEQELFQLIDRLHNVFVKIMAIETNTQKN